MEQQTVRQAVSASLALIVLAYLSFERFTGGEIALAVVSPPARTPLDKETVRKCLSRRFPPRRVPWIAFYGDSLARGIFFDTVALLNGSSVNGSTLHPGHSANYSWECCVMQRRPPLRRLKCAGFTYDAPMQGSSFVRVPLLTDVNDPSAVDTDGLGMARLSFRLKTFTWEPEFDDIWLRNVQSLQRLPDVLVISSGIWDMQYPPDGIPDRGANEFVRALRYFLTRLRKALHGRASPRVFWLSVTAVANSRLPLWKRSTMSLALARRYNQLASPVLRQFGVEMIDTFTSGAAHAEQSIDGVHFRAPVAHYHTQLLWETVCAKARRDPPL